MTTISLEEAKATLEQLIESLRPGEVITITRDHKPVAQLTGDAASTKPPRRLGTLKGTILFMAPDFDALLDEFREYIE